MQVLKNGCSATTFLALSFSGIAPLGCATTSQLKTVEEKTLQAFEMAEKALKGAQAAKGLHEKSQLAIEKADTASKEAKSAEDAVEDSAGYKTEPAASAQNTEDAASRAEKAAVLQKTPPPEPERRPKSVNLLVNGLWQSKTEGAVS